MASFTIFPRALEDKWKETFLYNVPSSEAYAEGSLVLDLAGNLNGTSNYDGTYNYGTVFELAHSGKVWTKSVIYSFTGGSDGARSEGGVVFDSAGKLFGVSEASAYELSPVGDAWKETTHF
jgi:hypothetical protein